MPFTTTLLNNDSEAINHTIQKEYFNKNYPKNNSKNRSESCYCCTPVFTSLESGTLHKIHENESFLLTKRNINIAKSPNSSSNLSLIANELLKHTRPLEGIELEILNLTFKKSLKKTPTRL